MSVMNGTNHINPMYVETLHILKGPSLLSTLALTGIFPLSAQVDPAAVRLGMVGHLIEENGRRVTTLGLPAAGNAVPMIYQQNGNDRAIPGGAYTHVPNFPANITAYDSAMNPNPTGNTMIVCTGGHELYAPAYDTTVVNWPVNTPLTAEPIPSAKAGLLTPGTYGPDIICGWVSRGLQVSIFEMNQNLITNPYGAMGLAFYTDFQPRLEKPMLQAILA
jgi:hypothetical protein